MFLVKHFIADFFTTTNLLGCGTGKKQRDEQRANSRWWPAALSMKKNIFFAVCRDY
jgi:hypothetical protein